MGDYADMAFDRDFDQWLEDGCPPIEDHRKGRGDDLVTIKVYDKLRETNKAWYLRETKESKPDWWPKSQCRYSDITEVLVAPKWLVAKKQEQTADPPTDNIVEHIEC